jgi:putative membrane protein
MYMLSNVLVGVVAALHFWFMVLEMFFWTKPLGHKTFGTKPEYARESKSLALNQGLYNGFLATGLVWSFVVNEGAGLHLQLFLLSCVCVAGIVGAITVNKKIFFVQALPAFVALFLVLVR